MATTVIGIDVGSSALRAVEVELTDPPVIRRIGQVGLPPGAMQDGEVVDVAAVTLSLRRLWESVGFTSKRVRLGFASARMIIRVIEMPLLAPDELRSAIRLQLDDLVPLPAEETVFDVQRLEAGDAAGSKRARKRAGAGRSQPLLLAAAHRNALEPLVDAARAAGLKVDAVDVVPAAPARALTTAAGETDEVDLIVSIGADTVVVVAAQHGHPSFARTLTNISGRRVTERVAARLETTTEDAELRKRWAVEDAAEALAARDAASTSIDELVDEVRDSIAYYAGQEGALPVRQVLLTGGGAQLSDLTEVMSERLGLPVGHADPFAAVTVGDIGFPPEDIPHLRPYIAAALGVALAGGAPKVDQLDLTPGSTDVRSGRGLKPVLAGGGAAVALVAVGAFYLQRRSAIDSEKAKAEQISAEVAQLQTELEAILSTGGPAESGAQVTPLSVVQSVSPRDIDWLATQTRLEALSTPLGVSFSSVQGAAEPPAPAVVPVAPVGDAGTGAAAGDATATPAPAPVEAPPAIVPVGRLTLAATAPDLNAIAAWLDAIAADVHFVDATLGGITVINDEAGTATTQFSVTVALTDATLVLRPYAPAPAATDPGGTP